MERVEQDVTVTYNANEAVSLTHNRDGYVDDNRRTQIGKNDTLEVGEDQSSVILDARAQDIGGDDALTVGKHLSVEVNGNTSVRSEGRTAIVAADEIKVQVGASSLVLKSSGAIHLNGTSITIDGASDVKAMGGKVNINDSAALGSQVGVTTRRPKKPSLAKKPRPEMSPASYAGMVEEGNLMMELCQCGSGKTCQLHR
ncbi:hypothetical protein VINE108274_15765 [Vibrio neptunius]